MTVARDRIAAEEVVEEVVGDYGDDGDDEIDALQLVDADCVDCVDDVVSSSWVVAMEGYNDYQTVQCMDSAHCYSPTVVVAMALFPRESQCFLLFPARAASFEGEVLRKSRLVNPRCLP